MAEGNNKDEKSPIQELTSMLNKQTGNAKKQIDTQTKIIDVNKKMGKSLVSLLQLSKLQFGHHGGQLGLQSEILEEMPGLKHDVEYDCEECGTKNEVQLTGLADFF